MLPQPEAGVEPVRQDYLGATVTKDWQVRTMQAADAAGVERLLDAAFGADRHGRTAYRLRAGTTALAPLCFVAERRDGMLIGTIQCWPVAVGGVALTLLGPLGVDPAHHGIGIGRALLAATTQAADAHGRGLMMLIGDEPYYAPFGFTGQGTGGWSLPGPYDPARLLVRNPDGLILPASGEVGPAPTPPPAHAETAHG